MSAVRVDWRSIAIPERMQRLDRDKRGFPIPYIVLRDPDGKPNFTINNTLKRHRCLEEDRCAICGGGLFRGRWFVGGPLSAFHEHGAYIDTPLHAECCEYALRVCPYLAAPKYAGRIDDKGLAWDQHPDLALLIDETMIAQRPALFVAVMATGQKLVNGGQYVKPVLPYHRVEYWRDGARIPENEGATLAQEALFEADEMETRAQALAPPRVILRPEQA